MQLRPYQQALKDKIYAVWATQPLANVMAVLATGGGKTVVFAKIAQEHKGATCVIAHRQELLEQISLAFAREGVRHRLIAPKKVIKRIVQLHMDKLNASFYSPSSMVAVAGVNTLIRRGEELRGWLSQVTLMIQDECFVAGTLIDGIPIENIKIGDRITAFNESTNNFEQRKVTRLFKNLAPNEIIFLEMDSNVLECTRNHPVWTCRGWVDAEKITLHDCVLSKNQEWLRVDKAEVITNHTCVFVYNLEVEGLHTYVANNIVVHNCHHVVKENQWYKASKMFPNAKGLLVTATPCRADGKGLGAEFDGVVHELVEGPPMRWMIDNNFLTDYRIFCPPSNLDLSEVSLSVDGDYNKVKLNTAVKQSTIMGDVVEHYKRIAPNTLGITFAPGVEIAAQISAQFNNAGVIAEVVSGKTDSHVRAHILERFRKREVMMLVNVDLFGEGFDLPSLETVIFARPTQSFSLFCQQFGRGLRILEGKTIATIIDHVGNVVRHGLPDAVQNWTLARRSKRAKKPYNDEIPLRVCMNVECMQPYERVLKKCPYCNEVPVPTERATPEQVDGDLCELSPETLAEMRKNIDRIDGPVRIPQNVAPYVGVAIKNKHIERQELQAQLRETLAYWAGMQKGDTSEIQKRFFFTFGVDTMTPLAYGKSDANDLRHRIQHHIGDMLT